jgi:hypothetical protein
MEHGAEGKISDFEFRISDFKARRQELVARIQEKTKEYWKPGTRLRD